MGRISVVALKREFPETLRLSGQGVEGRMILDFLRGGVEMLQPDTAAPAPERQERTDGRVLWKKGRT